MTATANASKIRGKRWSDADIAKLKELKGQGIAREEIAHILGRSLKSVEHKLYDQPIVTVERDRGSELSEEEIIWFVKHYKNTPNAEIQRKLSLSFSSLHRLARQYGLKKTKQFMRKTQERAAIAAKESHIRNGTYPPKGYVIPKSDIARFKPGKGRGVWERVSKKKAAQMKAKRVEIWHRIRKADHARWLFGFEQKTRFRFTKQSRDKIYYRYGLRKVGYIEDSQDHNVFYYPSEEMRRPIREANGAKFHIKFKPLLS